MESWAYALNPPRSDFGICNSGKKIGDKAQMTQQAEQVGINEGLTSSSMLKKWGYPLQSFFMIGIVLMWSMRDGIWYNLAQVKAVKKLLTLRG